MFLRLWIALLLSFSFAGCSYEEMAEKFTPKAESEFAKNILEKARQGQFSALKASFHPKLLEKADDASLMQVVQYFPEGEPLNIELIGSRTSTSGENWSGNFTFEYQFPEGWALAVANVARENGSDLLVTGLHVYRTEKSQREINAFSLSKKTAKHYLVLFGAVAVPIFIVVTLIYAIRTPIPKRKWLWVIFILVGIGSIGLNWTTGQLTVQPISVQLLGASVFAAGPHAPMVLGISIPVGAIMFWFRRKKFLAGSLADK